VTARATQKLDRMTAQCGNFAGKNRPENHAKPLSYTSAPRLYRIQNSGCTGSSVQHDRLQCRQVKRCFPAGLFRGSRLYLHGVLRVSDLVIDTKVWMRGFMRWAARSFLGNSTRGAGPCG